MTRRLDRHTHGGAYVAALSLMTVLLILGLSLAVLTATEVQIGSNERHIQRALYAAESGVHLAVAKALGHDDYRPMRIELAEPKRALSRAHLVASIETSAFLPVSAHPCHLCQADGSNGLSTSVFSITSSGQLAAPTAAERHKVMRRIDAAISLTPWAPSLLGPESTDPEGSQLAHASGLIRIIDDDEVITRSVTIVSGGPDDVDSPLPGPSSGFLRIVDSTTGQTLYEKSTTEATPTLPTLLDRDRDEVLDTVYYGTTAGILFKIDLREPQPLVGAANERRILSPDWDPFPIFATQGQSLHLSPIAIFVGTSGLYAIGFGTGDPENPWDLDESEGRLFMMMDSTAIGSSPDRGRELDQQDFESGLLPLSEADLQEIQSEDQPLGRDLLTSPLPTSRGWALHLEKGERASVRPVAAAGVTAFATSTATDTGENIAKLYVLDITNADPAGSANRSQLREGPAITTLRISRPTETGATAPQSALSEAVKRLAPATCRFGTFELNLEASGPAADIEVIGRIPICVRVSNWKEH